MISVVTFGPKCQVHAAHDAAALKKILDQGSAWVDFSSASPDEVALLASVFSFHQLSIDDCLDHVHYPKVDQFPDYLFVILHTLETVQGFRFRTTEVDFFITKNCLVTFHTQPSRVLDEIRKHLVSGALAMSTKPDLLFQNISSRYVQEYLPIIEALDEEIDSIEDLILVESATSAAQGAELTKRMLKVKKRLTYLKRLLAPQREVFSRLGRGEFPEVGKVAAVYCRDTYDSLFRITEMLDTFRDVLSSTLEAYLSVVSNRLNEVMKLLTIVTVIILPLSLIAGIYGMNFHYMPELTSTWGYPGALLSMVAVAVALVAYFKHRRWL